MNIVIGFSNTMFYFVPTAYIYRNIIDVEEQLTKMIFFGIRFGTFEIRFQYSEILEENL